MIPLKDRNPSYSIPFVNYALIAANFVVFFYELSLGPRLDAFFETYGLIPSRYFSMVAHHTHPITRYVPFLSSMFIHGGWLHIIGNMWFLFIFGDNVEDRLGHRKYLLFYFLSGLAAGFVQVFSSASSSVPTIGASGAISGVLGAYIVMFPSAKILTLLPIFFFPFIINIPAVLFIGFWFLMQFFSGVQSWGIDTSGGIAWWAHIGGFVAGILMVPIFKRRYVT
ncbi:MAG: rhomboid family intramembrane serine protease [Bacteroidetes bacterium]|nr:rhomboid family intramembrane serine protease [Bacteroidota bacterium]MCL5737449.1 rhomboid family intramembrane serine protease [Bacteroidota bacterium]